MLDIFTPEQKASILAQVMREESEGHSLRDCCRAQGITVQTFIDWRARARKHNQFDTLHMNGGHPERKPARFRQEKPKTALALALEAATVKTYPSDNPEDVAAVAAMERGEPDIPAPPIEAASGPENQPDPPATLDEDLTMPAKETTGAPRGVAGAMHKRMPWLAAIEKKTEKALGPKPENKAPGYSQWIAHRKTLMTSEQQAEIEAFFGVSARRKRGPGKKQLAEQVEIAAARVVDVVPDPVKPKPRTNGHAEAAPAEVSHAVAQYETSVRKVVSEGGQLAAENERLKKALTALTLENLQLRGLL